MPEVVLTVLIFFFFSSFECRNHQICNLPLLLTGSFGLLGTNIRRWQNYYRTEAEAFYFQNKALPSARKASNYLV